MRDAPWAVILWALAAVFFSMALWDWLRGLPQRLIDRAKRTPYFHLRGGEYMRRWWLVPYMQDIGDGTGPVSWRRPLAWLIQRAGFAVRIHEIMDSDTGRDPHDHPWSYVSVILRGEYWEDRFSSDGHCIGGNRYCPGSIIFRPAGSWHKLTLIDGPVTTLFITGKYRGTWGFNVGGKKVKHNDYTRAG